jgi:hypothetical protein
VRPRWQIMRDALACYVDEKDARALTAGQLRRCAAFFGP